MIEGAVAGKEMQQACLNSLAAGLTRFGCSQSLMTWRPEEAANPTQSPGGFVASFCSEEASIYSDLLSPDVLAILDDNLLRRKRNSIATVFAAAGYFKAFAIVIPDNDRAEVLSQVGRQLFGKCPGNVITTLIEPGAAGRGVEGVERVITQQPAKRLDTLF